eukprot:evm.model.scf_1067.3 EVM.evm.TU.scf_1067.3   scf_1067:30815-34712(-)
MPRKPGIAGLKARQQNQFQVAGDRAKETQKEQMKTQMASFKKSLEEFAMKYKQDIRKDPVFRAQFHQMCANIGVDPLSSNKGYWASLLGLGDFYYELGVQIIEICIAARTVSGGLLDLNFLERSLLARRGSAAEAVAQSDIVAAIKKLKVLGNGYDLVTLGSKSYVRSVPVELNTDKNRVLELAQDTGYLSKRELMEMAKWSDTRAEESLQGLLREGFAMIDDGAPSGVRLYWFPCVGVKFAT